MRDEAIGLIRTVQQFRYSKRVVVALLWKKVRRDVAREFLSCKIFFETLAKWPNGMLRN